MSLVIDWALWNNLLYFIMGIRQSYHERIRLSSVFKGVYGYWLLIVLVIVLGVDVRRDQAGLHSLAWLLNIRDRPGRASQLDPAVGNSFS